MPGLADAVLIAATAEEGEGPTAVLARAALECLARAVDGSSDPGLDVAFVADLMQTAREAGAVRAMGVVKLDVEADMRVHVIVRTGSVGVDVRNMKTGRRAVDPVCFVLIGGAPRQIPLRESATLSTLAAFAEKTARSLWAQRQQASLPQGVVSLAARRDRG